MNATPRLVSVAALYRDIIALVIESFQLPTGAMRSECNDMQCSHQICDSQRTSLTSLDLPMTITSLLKCHYIYVCLKGTFGFHGIGQRAHELIQEALCPLENP